MLPAGRRLRTKEVAEIIKRGAGARGVFMTAKALPGTIGGIIGVRAAAVVSKKVAKSAVERNRVRRALYRSVAEFELHPSPQPSPREGRGGNPPTTTSPSLNVVFFIRTIPPDPITPAFAKDVTTILRSLGFSKS